MTKPILYVMDQEFPLGETLAARLCAAHAIYPCWVEGTPRSLIAHDGYHLDQKFIGFLRLSALRGAELYDALVNLAFSGIHITLPYVVNGMTKRSELDALLEKARTRVESMTDEERRMMLREQKISWVYGEMNMDRAPGEERVSREEVAKIVDGL